MLLINLDNQSNFELYDGRHEVGSDDSATVYVEGATGATKFVVSEGVLSILQADGTIWLNGKRVLNYPVDMILGDVLSLGDDIHLLLGDEASQTALIPELEKPAVTEKVKTPIVIPWKKLLMVGMTMGVVSGVGVACTFLGSVDLERSPTMDVKKRILTPEQIIAYTSEYFGKFFIGAHFAEDRFIVYVEENPAIEAFKGDAETVLHHLQKPHQLEVRSFDFEKMRKDLENRIQESASKHVSVIRNGKDITIQGTTNPEGSRAIDEILEKQASELSIFQINNSVAVDNRLSQVKVLNTSVSAKQAVTTIRYKGQVITLKEGQSFELGIIKLIRHDGVTIGTAYGDKVVSL